MREIALMDGPAKNDQQSSIFPLIQSTYQSIEDAIQGFTQLEQIFYDRRDRRAIFVTAYLNITRAVKLRVEENWFQATTNEQATILQDLLLAVNTQLNHDLAIALLRTGI